VRVSWRVRGQGEPLGSPSPTSLGLARWALSVAAAWFLLVAVYVDEGRAQAPAECTGALDFATCEAIADRLDLVLAELAEEPPPVSGTVALAEGDAARLDLIWIGVFMAGGLSFGLVVGSWIKREQTGWGSRV
jgi:hypothetical protein